MSIYKDIITLIKKTYKGKPKIKLQTSIPNEHKSKNKILANQALEHINNVTQHDQAGFNSEEIIPHKSINLSHKQSQRQKPYDHPFNSEMI